MLSPHVPGDVHQFHRIERAAPRPGRASGMAGDALERVFDRNHAVIARIAIAGAKAGGDMGEDRDVHILEHSRPDIIGLGREQFLGHAGPEHQLALDAVLSHHLLGGDRSGNDQRHARIMPFAMAGRPRHDRLQLRNAGHLRQAQQPVDVRAQRDHRAIAVAPRRGPGGRDARHALGDGEAVLLEDARQILGGLIFLKARLLKAEHGIDHFLDELGLLVDLGHRFLLHRGRRLGLGGQRCRGHEQGGQQFLGMLHCLGVPGFSGRGFGSGSLWSR